MSFNDPVLTVENLSKCYQIYEQPVDRLKQMVIPPIMKLFSKPKRYFSEYWALKNVSFDIRQGETIGIIGENGAGKSTLLQLICGTLSPTSGCVEIHGRVAALLELGSGFNLEFTGVENIFMYGAVLGLSRQEMEKRFDAICRFADIGDFIHQPIKTYSSGMVVRLAFAVIVHVDADILVIDEALSVGDAFFVQKCMRFLREFIKKGTILFVSHDTGAVVNLCSRAIWIHNGRINLEGKAKEVTEEYLAAQIMIAQNGKRHTIRKTNAESSIIPAEKNKNIQDKKDMRLEFINRTNQRNDIELFEFKTDSSSFGQGRASVVNVFMTDEHGRLLGWIVGGENVVLIVECEAHHDLDNPIIGFFIKDRLGQNLFGDNTFITYQANPIHVAAGRIFQARFCFRMPLLPIGNYSVAAAVAEGTQENHLQQHWLHDALIFQSHSSSVAGGLVGIPMTNIEMKLSPESKNR